MCLGGEAPLVESARNALEAGGDAWWRETLALVGRDALPGTPEPGDPRSRLSDLLAWKEAGKDWTLRRDPPDAAVRGTMVYLVTTALAVCDHQRTISTRPSRELVPAWLDLAEVAPEPLAWILARAALRLDPKAQR